MQLLVRDAEILLVRSYFKKFLYYTAGIGSDLMHFHDV